MANFIKSYQELEAAFRFKRKNPDYPEFRFKEGTLKYEGENGIFDQARNRFFNRFDLPKDNLKMVDQILDTIDIKEISLEQYLNPHQTLSTQTGQPIEGLPEQIPAAPVGPAPTGESAVTMTGEKPVRAVRPHPPVMPNIPRTGVIPKTETPKVSPVRVQAPRIPTGVSSFGKTGGGRVARGFGSLFGSVARGGGGLLIKAGGAGGDALARASNQASKGGLFKPSKQGVQVMWAFVGAFFLFFIFSAISGLSTGTPTGEAALLPGGTAINLAITLAGPGGCTDDCKANNSQEVTYEIKFVYNGPGSANVEISGKIPDGVNLSKASLENWNSSSGNFSQVISGLNSKQEKTLSLTLKPDDGKIDFWTSFNVTASVVRPTLPADITSGVIVTPPSDDTCAGRYVKEFESNPNPSNKNFGDPTCTYSDDDLYALLTILDPDQAPFWWLLVDCESTYRPNIVNVSAKDPAGAWGLFQMGRGKNGIYDYGDVQWQKQISNAINKKNSDEAGGIAFRGSDSYWAIARPNGVCPGPHRPIPK